MLLRNCHIKRIFLILLLLPFISLAEDLKFDLNHLNNIDIAINAEIKRGNIPGAVVLIGKGNKTIYLKAFGNRRTYKRIEKMTIDTVFDISSITKPLATASSVWKLIEMGKMRLWDRVSLYIPEFKKGDDKNKPLRIYHLMTHTGGLAPSYDEKLLKKKYKNPKLINLIKEIAVLKRKNLPGESFKYSCLGYIVLGHIVEKISGKKLSKFAEENIFSKLDMKSTSFNPQGDIKKTCPTELVNGVLLDGTVHDPLARSIGGISGNAGLFSTAGDLSKFAGMLLNNGYYKGRKMFSPLTVKAFISIYPLLKEFGRSPGWDVCTTYSSSRGDLFPAGSFGHTGFTGTSIWIDPKTRVFVILLSNRVHPYRRKSIIRLYSIISNIVAASINY